MKYKQRHQVHEMKDLYHLCALDRRNNNNCCATISQGDMITHVLQSIKIQIQSISGESTEYWSPLHT